MFESKLDASLPFNYKEELRNSAEADKFNLEQELKTSNKGQWPDMSTWSQAKKDAADDDFDLIKYQLENLYETLPNDEASLLQHKLNQHEMLRMMQTANTLTENEKEERSFENLLSDLQSNMTMSNRLGLEWDKLF